MITEAEAFAKSRMHERHARELRERAEIMLGEAIAHDRLRENWYDVAQNIADGEPFVLPIPSGAPGLN